MKILFYCLFTVIRLVPAIAERSSMNDLVNGTYQRHLRPYYGVKPLELKNNLLLASVGPIDEQDMTFQLRFYHQQWWTDPRLAWNTTNIASNEDVTSNAHPGQLIWLPDTYVVNVQDVKYFNEFTRTIIKSNGEAYFSREVYAKCRCLMDLRKYPVDEQTCHIRIESYAYNTKGIDLKWLEGDITFPDSEQTTSMTGYELKDITREHKVVSYGVGSEYNSIYMNFHVQRNSVYYAYKAFIPTIFLTVFNIGSYFVPDTAMPARVTLIITTFLANMLILQSVTEQTIKVSYTTAMQLFLLINLMFLMVSILQYLILLFTKYRRIQKQAKKKAELAMQNRYTVDETGKEAAEQEKTKSNGNVEMTNLSSHLNIMKKHMSRDRSNDLHILDRIFRVIAPSVYFLFLIVFFSYYRS